MSLTKILFIAGIKDAISARAFVEDSPKPKHCRYDSLERISQTGRFKRYDWFEKVKGDRGDSNALLAMGLRETQAADVFITQ
jgi:hypothetical protein